MPEVAKDLCAGLVSVDPVCRDDPLTVALDGGDLPQVDRVRKTGILGDQVCGHPLSHGRHEWVTDQRGLQVDELRPPDGLLVDIPLLNGGC